MPSRIVPFAIAFGIFVLDRLTKDSSKPRHGLGNTARDSGFFNIVHAENPGVAFGLLAESTGAWRNVFLIGLSLTVLVFITALLWQGRGRRELAAARRPGARPRRRARQPVRSRCERDGDGFRRSICGPALLSGIQRR